MELQISLPICNQTKYTLCNLLQQKLFYQTPIKLQQNFFLPSLNHIFKMKFKYSLVLIRLRKGTIFNQIIFCGLLVLVMIHHGHQQAMMFVIFISTYVICIVNRAQACLVPSGISMGENSIYPLVCKE